MLKNRFPLHFLKGLGRICFHVLLVALSAGIAFSLPIAIGFIARNFFIYWSVIENEKLYLISAETALAILLILLFNYLGRSWRDARLSRMARSAGLAHVFPTRGPFAQRKIKRLKNTQGFARDVLVISSTGFRTFVDPQGDLHRVLQGCREARILLLNPYSQGAKARAQSILDPNVTPENFRAQIRRSVEFLKGLKATQKNIKLKLYADSPFLKLVILGDYIWMKHYHPGLDVNAMPEFVFEHDQNPGSLYAPLYQYFHARWDDPDIPEYDFETDELVYRDETGNERARERFADPEGNSSDGADNHFVARPGISADSLCP